MLLHFLGNLITFFITLGILITVHECGHFLAARFFKVKVERFSIGFGPVLWRWYDSIGTEYVISAILLGGYVKLLNTQIKKNVSYIQEEYHVFNRKYIWKQIIIVISGPVSNFIFSVISYTLVFMIGIPVYKPIINSILPYSIIAQSGILPGVEIKSINNIRTYDWEAVRTQIYNCIERKEELIISTTPVGDTCLTTYTIQVDHDWFNKFTYSIDPIIALGIIPCNLHIVPVLSKIQSNSAAKQAGLKIGDEILSIDGQKIHDWESFIMIIKDDPEKKFKIEVKRKNQILNLNLILNKKYSTHFNIIEDIIGASPKIIVIPMESHNFHRYGLYTALTQAVYKTWRLMYLITNTVFKLISGNINLNTLGGPISIAQGAGKSVQSGIIYYLMFLALISINLGIVNLLPFPALDGGHLLFLLIENIKGTPISKNIQNIGYIIGYIILILIMCVTFFNDISKL